MKKNLAFCILDTYNQFVPSGTYQMQLDYLVQPCKRHNHLHSMLTQKENYNPIICCNGHPFLANMFMATTVEVVLRHFHWCRYSSSPL
jgi:hypothetical protein